MKNDFENATTTYQKMIAKNSRDSKLWYNLAETHLKVGRTKEALACFERIANNPDITPAIFVRIAACYETLGNPKKAIQMLETLLHKNIPDVLKENVTSVLHKLHQQYRFT